MPAQSGLGAACCGGRKPLQGGLGRRGVLCSNPQCTWLPSRQPGRGLRPVKYGKYNFSYVQAQRKIVFVVFCTAHCLREHYTTNFLYVHGGFLERGRETKKGGKIAFPAFFVISVINNTANYDVCSCRLMLNVT